MCAILHVIAHMYSLSLLEQTGALSLSQKKGKKDKNDKKDKHDEINMTNNGGSNTTVDKRKPDTAPDNPDDWRATSIRKKQRGAQSQSSSGVCNFACYRTHVLTLFA